MQRVVIITGASRGLGLSLAKNFLQAGDQVFGVSRSTRYWKSAYNAANHSENFSLHQIDLTQESKVRQFIRKIHRKAKRLDIVINNAGYGGSLHPVETLPAREWKKSMENNLYSAFLVSKAVIPFLKKQKKGWLVQISSMAGQRAVPKLAAYSAAKFGVLALSQCIAKENKEDGLVSITVCPGGMNTQMRSDLFGEEDAKKQQSTDYVAGVIFDVIEGKIQVESGGDIVIRHGQITAIHPCPGI